MRPIRLLLIIPLFLFSLHSYGQVTTVAVAANMKDAFIAINEAFRTTDQSDIRAIYGSSGNFAAQIINGAPFHLFISADEYYPLELYKKRIAVDEGKVYAIGKLVLLTKKSKGIALLDTKTDLTTIFSKANKIAIAKPELAPYGSAAVEYMKAAGLWDLAKNKLVYADNISVATSYIASGAADIGFTALSLAQTPAIAKETHYLMVNERLYTPIKQRMVLIKNPPQNAIKLYQFMQTPKARAILASFGYALP